MTGADLEWSDVEVNIAGLNEGVDKRLLPPGQLATVRNCEFTSKDGSLRKRPGAVNVSGPPWGVLEAGPSLTRLLAHDTKNQLLGVDLRGYAGTSPALYAPLDAPIDADQSMPGRRLGFATNALVRRYPIASDLWGNVLVDGAYVATTQNFGYMVYGYVLQGTGDIGIKIVQVPKRGIAYEPENTVTDEIIPYARGGGTAFWVRAAASSDSHVLITWQTDGGDFKAVVVDCIGAALPTIGSLTTIVSGVLPSASLGIIKHDSCESTLIADLTAPNWIVAWASGGVLYAARFDDALATDWNMFVPQEADAISVFERDGAVWLNWFDSDPLGDPAEPAWRYMVVNTTDGSQALGPTVWCDASDIGAVIGATGRISGIAYAKSVTDVVLFHSQCSSLPTLLPYGVWEQPVTRWRRVRDDGSQDGLRQKRGVYLWSKPWVDVITGWYQAWCGAIIVREDPDQDFPSVDHTALLMRFSESAAEEAALATAFPIAATAHLVLGGYTKNVSPIVLLPPPRSITYGAYAADYEPSALVGRRTTVDVRFVPLEARSSPWDIVVRYHENDSYPAGFGRYQFERFGGSVYCAGGLLTQWDGDRHHEAGFLTSPSVIAKVDTSGGTGWPVSWADGHLFFMVVYETVNENGERTRSATSNVVDVHLGTPPMDDKITLYIEPPTLTMRSYGGSNQEYAMPRTMAVVYGSTEINSAILHRLYEFGSPLWDYSGSSVLGDVDALTPITIEMVGFGSPPYIAGGISDRNEVIYTDSGELDNDAVVGGCSCIAVHKDRLWVGGGDDAEVIWYSKERVDGRPAEFSIGQQIRLPGKGVVALASLDDSLIVFCERAIFAVYGEGPNATGDPSSGFFTVVPISTTVGCNAASSLCVTPSGIIFKGESGLMMLDRARAINYIGAVGDSSLALFAPVAAVVEPALQQARLLYVTGEASDALVFDWSNGMWATWRYNFGQGAVVDQQRLGRNLYLLTADGSIHREDANVFADNGSAYRQYIEFGEMSFGRTQGYKRVGHMGILAEPNPWMDYSASPHDFPCGISATVNLNYSRGGAFATTHEWSAYELGQIVPRDGVTMLRAHIGKKQPSVGVVIEEVPPGYGIATSSADPINTVGASVLRIRITFSGAYTIWTFTASAALSKAALLAEVNTKIATAGWTAYLKASLVGGLLLFETIKRASPTGLGSWLQVDSVAAGSTLNTPLGLSSSGVSGSAIVREANQSGFILQTLNFEVGQARGPRRLPAAQSR